MKNAEYWTKRFTAIEDGAHTLSARSSSAFLRAFDSTNRAINEKVALWLERCARNNNVDINEARKILSAKELKEFKWDVKEYIQHGKDNALNRKWMTQLENASSKHHITRLEALKLHIQARCEDLYGKENNVVKSAITDAYEYVYTHGAFEVAKGWGFGVKFDKIDGGKLDALIRQPWTADGMNFSDRVWRQKAQMIDALNTELTRTCVMGESVDKAIAHMAQFTDSKFGTGKVQAGRLVMTESAHIASVAQHDLFDELDVEKYQIVATLDDHTSDICQEMDGQIFEMKDYQEGVTAPPFHVNCRSTTIPYFEDNKTERFARDSDGSTYSVPSDLKYSEWREKFYR